MLARDHGGPARFAVRVEAGDMTGCISTAGCFNLYPLVVRHGYGKFPIDDLPIENGDVPICPIVFFKK